MNIDLNKFEFLFYHIGENYPHNCLLQYAKRFENPVATEVETPYDESVVVICDQKTFNGMEPEEVCQKAFELYEKEQA